MSKISKTRGKNFELAVARYLGCKRNHFESEDLKHWLLSIECKHRKKLPVLVTNFIEQAEAAAEESKIPCVVMHEFKQKYEDSLVVLRLKDFKNLVTEKIK
jgi:hypothetical protein